MSLFCLRTLYKQQQKKGKKRKKEGGSQEGMERECEGKEDGKGGMEGGRTEKLSRNLRNVQEL